MKLIRIDDSYLNVDKIIQIYERPKNPLNAKSEMETIIELEGFRTGNTGYNGETPYYSQNEVRTDIQLNEVIKLLAGDNT